MKFLPNYFGGNQLGDKLLKLSNLLSESSRAAFQKRIVSNYDNLLPILKSQKRSMLIILIKSMMTVTKI